MIILYIIGLYVAGIISMMLWDTYIGFGFEFDGNDYPPFPLALLFWPLALPLVIFIGLGIKLSKIKEKRISRANQKRKLRIAAEKETAELMEEIDREIKQKSAGAS